MKDYYFSVQNEPDEPIITMESVEEIYSLLLSKGLISVLRYNDSITGEAYLRMADQEGFSAADRVRFPIFIYPGNPEDGVFVQSEEVWIENYMLGEFYNPERMPYIEKMINSDTD